jgi:UDP-glucose-4-epimerase GalE
MNRTVVVTGGCGYIGSHVARAFKQNGDTVNIIDQVRRDHTLKDIDGYLIADFASDEALSLIVNLEPDVVVHCAGTSLVGPSMTDPAEYYTNNIVKTIALLNVVRHMSKRPVILFSSSASVYGVPDTWPTDEGSDIQPISPYGATKAMTERILDDYFKAYDIHSMCFRYFNAAGAEPFNSDLGQEPGATHIVARALEASIADRAFTINGDDYDTDDGTCVRDYVHVWDLARAHILGVNYLLDDYPQPGAYVLNLGTREGISNKQIVDYVFNKYGLPFVNYGPRRSGDPDTLVADATQAKNLLGWVPEHSSIETIIDSAHKWYTK